MFLGAHFSKHIRRPEGHRLKSLIQAERRHPSPFVYVWNAIVVVPSAHSVLTLPGLIQAFNRLNHYSVYITQKKYSVADNPTTDC